MWEGKQILVAGASGFIGGNLASHLAEKGAFVRGSYLTHAGNVPISQNIEAMQVDLTRKDHCEKAVAGCEIVFMCAAVTSGAAVIRGNPLSHVTPNVLMNAQMLEAANCSGVQEYIFLSTGCVYPEVGGRALKEDEAFAGPPAEVYFAAGWMKRYSEILCKLYSREKSGDMNCVVIRPSNVYGPGDKFGLATSHVTAAQIRNVFEKLSPIVVWGDGQQIRDLIYIDDFIEGLVQASLADDPYFEVNIASGRGWSVQTIVETAVQVANYKPEIKWDTSRPTTVDVIQFDVERARQKLGFETKVPLVIGIKNTLDWLSTTPKSLWDR